MAKAVAVPKSTPLQSAVAQPQRTLDTRQSTIPETTTAAVNGKKKKKKKAKGKAAVVGGGNIANPMAVDGGDEGEDDDNPVLAPLERTTDYHPPNLGHRQHHPQPPGSTFSPNSKPGSRTGLSPDLESVHISTTASLAAAATTIGTHPATTPTELMNTAHDLYRRIDANESMITPEDSDYWTTLPPAIRSFVQNAYAQGALTGGTDPDRAHAMYTIAQHMINSGQTGPRPNHRQQMQQLPQPTSSPYPPGAYPSFDASLFSDPAFTQALEQLIPPHHAHRFPNPSGNGHNHNGVPPAPGQPPQGPLPPTNVVLLNEFGAEEHQQLDEEYYSEDDEDDVEVDVDVVNGRHASAQFTLTYDTNGRPRTTATYTTTTMTQPPPPPNSNPGEHLGRIQTAKRSTPFPPDVLQQQQASLDTTDPSKKNKKKKKKKGLTGVVGQTIQSPPLTPAVPTIQPTPRESVPIPIQSAAPQQPTPPSARPAPILHPPPSARAAGKQPMSYSTTNPTPIPNPPRTSRAASKAPANGAGGGGHYHQGHHHPSPPSSNAPSKPRPPASAKDSSVSSQTQQKPKNLWGTNTNEERERIKDFWLGLGEDERRALVNIEKEAVLRKMKDQQKHSCGCAVCGRKRSAIEEELEVLYDAYYEELEQYADYQQRYVSSGGKLPPPPGPGPFPGSVELDKNGAVIGPGGGTNNPPPNAIRQQQVQQPPDDEDEYDEDEDDYADESDDAADDDLDDDEDPSVDDERVVKGVRRTVDGGPPIPPNPKGGGDKQPVSRPDFFNFGSGLAVTGNILTVADDLLKNDGQKFLEMMEQLAERRMIREEAAAEDVMTDEDSDEDGGSDEEDSGDDVGEDEDDEDEMTEEQKMEEGRRMFSIFAARMFEQRVLQAYREKVAQERQLQLLRELEEEDKLAADREAKKAKENQKKKDKKKQQKLAKDEERARKEAEKAAEEASLKAKQEAHEEEARKRKEEERVRRETDRKAKEEEKKRKEEERRKRQAEEKEREAERREKALREKERLKKEREEKEARERERLEKLRVEKAEREAKSREEFERREREKEIREREERERKDREEKEREKEEREKEKEKEKERLAMAAAAAQKAIKPVTLPAAPISAPVPPRPSTSRTNGPTQPSKKATGKSTISASASSSSSSLSSRAAPPPLLQSPPSVQASRPPALVNPTSAPPSRRPTMLQTPQTPQSGSVSHLSGGHSPFGAGPSGMSSFVPPSPGGGLSFGGPPQFAMQNPVQGPHLLQPSAVPRGFGPPGSIGGPGGNADFHSHPPQQGHPPPPPGIMSPIGPPRIGSSPGPNHLLHSATPGAGPSGLMGMGGSGFSPGPPIGHGHVRRASVDPIGARSSTLPPFGAITRPNVPIAPIGTRPTGSSLSTPIVSASSAAPSSASGLLSSSASVNSSILSDGDEKMNGTSSSSPVRRSPESERLGSSALVDPEDEPLPSTGGRRTNVMGSLWTAPGPEMPGKSGIWNSFGPRPVVSQPLPLPSHLPQPQNATWGNGPMMANPWGAVGGTSIGGGHFPSGGPPGIGMNVNGPQHGAMPGMGGPGMFSPVFNLPFGGMNKPMVGGGGGSGSGGASNEASTPSS